MIANFGLAHVVVTAGNIGQRVCERLADMTGLQKLMD
jgi:hypothetical protein